MEVWITGMAIWCSVGRTVQEFDAALRLGRSGSRPVTRFDVSDPVYRTRCAASLIRESDLQERTDATLITDLALTVTDTAIGDAELAPRDLESDRTGMVLATSHGANLAFMKFLQGRLSLPGGRLDPALAVASTPTVAGNVAAHVGLEGPIATVSTACAAGTNAVGLGAEMIDAGLADVVLAGGVDLYTPLSFSGFNILAAMARGPCRPLDRKRDGMMLGDGAAMFVLESEAHARARGVKAFAIVAGHATANEAFHPTAPRPDGSGGSRVMTAALASADVAPEDVDYINLHATGTPANDVAELEAVASVFGTRAATIPMSSTKSMVGHTLGAAGAVEAAAVVLGMMGGYAPPSINLREPIERFADWTYVRDAAMPLQIDVALSNSFGFSGHLASIVFRRPAAHDQRVVEWIRDSV